MNKTELLLQRLDDIGQSLKDSRQALALLALGSCGVERDRLDQYSDLDFCYCKRWLQAGLYPGSNLVK